MTTAYIVHHRLSAYSPATFLIDLLLHKNECERPYELIVYEDTSITADHRVFSLYSSPEPLSGVSFSGGPKLSEVIIQSPEK